MKLADSRKAHFSVDMLLLWLIILALSAIYYVERKKRFERIWKHILQIPGPEAKLLIGTNYKLISCEDIFERERRRMREFFPIYKTWIFHTPFVHLADPDDMEVSESTPSRKNCPIAFTFQKILTKPIHITKGLSAEKMFGDWLHGGLIMITGSKWYRRRKLLEPSFHFNNLKTFAELFYVEAQALVEDLKKNCHEPYTEIENYAYRYTLCCFGTTSLGFQLRDNDGTQEYLDNAARFKRHVVYRLEHPWLLHDGVFKFTALFRSFKQNLRRIHEFGDNIIRERTKALESVADAKPPMLDLLLKARSQRGDIDDKAVKDEINTFIAAAHDTSAASLCFTLMLLANNKEAQEEMYEEIVKSLGKNEVPSYYALSQLKFMDRCISESLRIYPVAPILNRIAGEEVVTKSGHTIPKGCNMLLNVIDMHRAPEIWDEPDKFEPDRFLPENVAKRHRFAYLPFAAGQRNCIGKKFALVELKAALCAVLRSFVLEPVDRPEDVKCINLGLMKPVRSIRVKFVPRN
ncbi:unnamed protein product [Phyllotreta striolata]|uniref:Cytochrome P450 monooxygenase n=1 Tax=Phyllotreta striolata TaxID=444603 RepID=A0A9P0DQ40_PHYSR|nr:unnamed protein product [Phyllotreta striolata]